MDSTDLPLLHTRRSLYPPPPFPPPSTDANFPILITSILGILAISILLLIYYVFADRCRLIWRRSNAGSSFSGPLHRHGIDSPMPFPAVAECRGLGESEIQTIPMFLYRSGKAGRAWALVHECAVCLNEFQKDERIRLLPNCFHIFHTDCIDTWLQTNANCPLCRAGLTAGSPVQFDHLMASIPNQESSGDVVIHVRDDDVEATGEEKATKAGGRRGSMGDECIGLKGSCVLHVQPMRRSFSVDSLMDRQLEMVPGQNLHLPEVAGGQESSGDGQVQRSLFSLSLHCLVRFDLSSTVLQGKYRIKLKRFQV